jgi:glyoxylase-like metal-dependent hydrolase (beta-lactamase superfamily II)
MQGAQQLRPWLWLLERRTSTLPPATATNTMVVGADRIAIIEPATPHPEEQRRLDTLLESLAAQGRRPSAVLVTHHHVDHVGYAERLRDRWSVPLLAHSETADRVSFEVDLALDHGDVLELGDGVAIEASFTPGHAPGHLVYLERRSGIAHVGDMVAGQGTILIDPQDAGDMAAYLASLQRMKQLEATAFVPAHGPVLDDPIGVLDHYIEHRLARESKVVGAVAAGGSDLGDVLAGAYADTPRPLWPLAVRSLEAHLRKLEAEGRVRRDGDRVIRCDGPPSD